MLKRSPDERPGALPTVQRASRFPARRSWLERGRGRSRHPLGRAPCTLAGRAHFGCVASAARAENSEVTAVTVLGGGRQALGWQLPTEDGVVHLARLARHHGERQLR